MVPYVSYASALSLSLRYSRSARVAVAAAGVSRERRGAAVIVIRYRRALSAKLELGTGVCDGFAASIAGKLTLYRRLLLPRSALQSRIQLTVSEFFTSHLMKKKSAF